MHGDNDGGEIFVKHEPLMLKYQKGGGRAVQKSSLNGHVDIIGGSCRKYHLCRDKHGFAETSQAEDGNTSEYTQFRSQESNEQDQNHTYTHTRARARARTHTRTHAPTNKRTRVHTL